MNITHTYDVSAFFKGNSLDFVVFVKYLEPALTNFGMSILSKTEIYYKLDGTYIQLEDLSANDTGNFRLIASFNFEMNNNEAKKVEKVISEFTKLKGLEKENF